MPTAIAITKKNRVLRTVAATRASGTLCPIHNGSADFAVKLAEFFEGGHGERYAGGRQNDAVVKVLNHLFAVADASEQAGRAEAQSHRHDYAQKSDDDGRFAGRANLLEVGFETC